MIYQPLPRNLPTLADIDQLILQWKYDPCWTLSETNGFYCLKPLLKLYEDIVNAVYYDREIKRKCAIAVSRGLTSDQIGLIEYLELVETELDLLRGRVAYLEDR